MALRWLLAALLTATLTLVSSLAIPASGPYVPPTLIKSIVRLQVPGDATYCTGFVIDQKRRYVLTADHCMGGSPPIIIRRSLGAEIFHIPEMDAAVIQLSEGDPLPPALKADLRPLKLEQEVAAFGYANGEGMKRINMFVVFPNLGFPGADGWFTLLAPEAISGMSGGPIFSDKGVIGMNMAGRSDPDLSVIRSIIPVYEGTKQFWSETPEGADVEVHPEVTSEGDQYKP